MFSPAGDNRQVKPTFRLARVIALLLFMAPACSFARYTIDAGSPWTYSWTGTESASTIVLDHEGFVWMAGNHVGSNRDVLFFIYDNINFGSLLGGFTYDPTGAENGTPVLFADWHQSTSVAHSDIWLAFTVTRAGDGGNMYFKRISNPGESTNLFEYDSGFSETLAGLSVISRLDPAMQDPAGVGTVNIGGKDMLEFTRYSQYPGNNNFGEISTTAWDPGGSPVYGKACVRGEANTTWAVGQTNSGILLLKFTSSNWTDAGGNGRPEVVPGFPVFSPETAPIDVRSAVRDAGNNLWVGGTRDNIGAVWKFSSGGVLAAGFPLTYSGTGASSFNALAMDEESNAFAVGRDGEEMLLAGINQAGVLVSVTLYDARDIVVGNGICIGADRSIWIAGTITATASSTIWAGTESALFRYAWSIDPSPAEIEDFVLRAPHGGVLNLAKSETMSIFINPPRAGTIKVVILTMRGEIVRDFNIQSGGGRTVSAIWDGRNSAGETVATGVYAIRVTGGGVKGVKRAAVIWSKK